MWPPLWSILGSPSMAETAAKQSAVTAANIRTTIAVALLAVFVVAAALGPYVAPYDPLAPAPLEALTAPSLSHAFGTDAYGRDILSRVLVATRLDLIIAVAAVLIALTMGTALGAFAGWAGGWPDRIIGRIIDTIMAFPLFVLAVGVAAGLGNSISSVIVATAIVNLPFYARQARSDVSRQRKAAYVEAAALAGFSPILLVLLQILPNIAPPLMVQSSLNLGWAILNAAGLSFIGLGVRAPTAEWGIMVSEGAANIFSGEWWMFIFPGAALMIAILTFSLCGDALRDLLDPKRR
jgi:peptide/nickel transport system permease protein